MTTPEKQTINTKVNYTDTDVNDTVSFPGISGMHFVIEWGTFYKTGASFITS
jgi:hypothetical protein